MNSTHTNPHFRAVTHVSAPARVNLLGEHTDYTGGFVLPVAIPFQTRASIRPDPGHADYRFRSEQFPGERVIGITSLEGRQNVWSDYPLGVLRELQKLNINPPPFVLELTGTVPFGAGLSSSASIEVASCLAMLRLAGESLAPPQVAQLCQRAENLFVQSPCGIMDQFVITSGRADHALMLNTRDLTYKNLPLNRGSLEQTCIVVCNSGVKHSVAAGEYGTRRLESEQAQEAICASHPGIRDLGDSTVAMLDAVVDRISRSAYKRAHHIITENVRVLQAMDAMLDGDAAMLGSLITAAHASERDDFECSCEEVDFLVDTAVSLPGCLGARLTGGGFGGCTVNLVQRAQSDHFVSALKHAYRDRWSIDAQTYVCKAVDGAMMSKSFLEGAEVEGANRG